MKPVRIWEAPEAELNALLDRLERADRSMADAALAYARLGLPVFPCSPATKRPFVKNGFKAASADPDTVTAWWKRWPRAMIGMPTGSVSGVLVIDIDAGSEAEAHEQLERLRLRIGGKLPPCPIVWTPRGGAHLWLAWRTETALGNRANILRAAKGNKGIDVRGEGGYVILPPSKRNGVQAAKDECDGKAYAWDEVSHLAEMEPPAPPQALIDLILRRNDPEAQKSPTRENSTNRRLGSAGSLADRRKQSSALQAFHNEIANLERLTDGRANTLFTAACNLGEFVAGGWLSRSMVEAALEQASHTNGEVQKKGLRSVRASIKSGLDRTASKPRNLSHIDVEEARRSRQDQPLNLAKGKAKKTASNEDKPVPQRDRLIEIGLKATLFHWDDDAFASVMTDGREETYRLRSRAFRRWLSQVHFQDTRGAPGGEALNDAILVLEGFAFSEGENKQAHVRLAEHQGCIYLDLGSDDWQIVEITSAGWRVIPAAISPAKFIRPRGLRPLPRPETGGSLKDLEDFVNVDTADLPLVYAWLVAAFRPSGPFPILALVSQQGSGKSTLSRVLRALVDPNAAPIRTAPREERDLLVAAHNSWVIAIDNMSEVQPWLADGLCRLSTGGGMGSRELHTNLEEVIFEAQRPQILNGLGDIATRPDLADRALVVPMKAIGKDERRAERDFWREFEEQRPFLLGSILDAVSGALMRINYIELSELPRMADFALWAVAAEPSLPIVQGSFSQAYKGNRDGIVNASIENDRFISETVKMMNGLEEWEGAATDLLKAVRTRIPDEDDKKDRGFPKKPNAVGMKLRRFAVAMEAAGIKVEFVRESDSGRARLIRLTRIKT